jgi:hypothetical protein
MARKRTKRRTKRKTKMNQKCFCRGDCNCRMKKSSRRSKGKSKRRSPSKYNLFVKKMSPILKNKNKSLKQPQIMRLIAKEWKKQ